MVAGPRECGGMDLPRGANPVLMDLNQKNSKFSFLIIVRFLYSFFKPFLDKTSLLSIKFSLELSFSVRIADKDLSEMSS